MGAITSRIEPMESRRRRPPRRLITRRFQRRQRPQTEVQRMQQQMEEVKNRMAAVVAHLREAVQESSAEKEVRYMDHTCIVCYEETATHVLLPCWHHCLCHGCVARMTAHDGLKKCPYCRGAVEDVHRVFTVGREENG